MKYFEIQDSPELKYAPKLKNWYGKFDVRNICPDGFPKLPQRELFLIEPSINTMFTDMILYPFLLISPMIQEVIQMYREPCFFREVILLEQLSGKSIIYYLPVLDETERIQVRRKEYRNGICTLDTVQEEGNEIYVDRNLFWVRDSKKRHIIISLDMAESLIRRGVIGLGLCEVSLYTKD